MLGVRKTVHGRGSFWVKKKTTKETKGGDEKSGEEALDGERLRKGTDVIKGKRPFAHVVEKAKMETVCQTCFVQCEQLRRPLQRCAGCKALRYCSAACQKADWKDHKPECAALKRISPVVPATFVMFLARILRKMERNTGEMDVLQLHMPGEPSDPQQQRGLFAILEHLRHFLPDAEKHLLKSAYPVLRITSANSFGISGVEGNNLGVGLYDTVSYINHSCAPNCSITFSGVYARVRSVHDLPPNQELTIAYIDPCDPRAKRRAHLKSQFMFDCECSRCERERDDDPLLTLCCPGSGCDQIIKYQLTAPPDDTAFEVTKKCERGHLDDPATFDSWSRKVKRVLGIIGEANKARRPVQGDMASFERLLPPTNYLMHIAYTGVLDQAIGTGQFQEALQWARKVILVYDALNSPMDPLRGIELLRVAKLQALARDGRGFLETIQKAVDVIRLTHGEDSVVYQQVLALH
ncbi:hypothetical protein PTSG_04361 [Salpingoeca rosetta]|uniref:MYND-type domain-containing protein n=1 Tax=Salpingoeca rosetta (strain ATCC 50818 / BSB-021) TaxID=946362 RepID=F2U8B8_SALR5|nr:uncharacterized protein PTSG_04361 [Salpingoeca rosetta]EGD72626.1 hypothetical protein PTSG_04361 [Salpingoeca rosetta]|eukprot:XP_004994449.1 hypothetical protein PTSG_04361 [Salpingoeca rosetta]